MNGKKDLYMLENDLKKKIANTIANFEVKFDQMQQQISGLKNVIHQLIVTPISTHYEIDDHLAQVQKQIDDEFDPNALEEKVNYVSTLLAKLQKKKIENAKLFSTLLKESTDSIGLLATKSQDKKALSKLQKMLESDGENQTILVSFNEVLTQCVTSVINERNEQQNTLPNNMAEVNSKVKDSLQQLLNHLSIPKNLESKKDKIKLVLGETKQNADLSKIIDSLTELVVNAFNEEQNRFKGFLQQLTSQLEDVDVYLDLTVSDQREASDESLQLEHGIQENIKEIKSCMDSSTTIEELTSKISNNLDVIGSRIKEYRENEKKRSEKAEKKIHALKDKLHQSEQSAEEFKHILATQKYKINHDSLTGLPNREAYDEKIMDAYHRWKRNHKDLSIAVCDIDHFKHVNDTFGHLAGDKVLKKVAELLKGAIRSIDFIARVGGEEFVLIFEQTSTDTAQAVVEKLRKQVQECQFYYKENKVDVTVSFGVTSIKTGDDNESLFIRADNAMYAAKKGGRNRVEVL